MADAREIFAQESPPLQRHYAVQLDIEKMLAAADRTDHLTKGHLFSRKQANNLQLFDLNDSVKHIEKFSAANHT